MSILNNVDYYLNYNKIDEYQDILKDAETPLYEYTSNDVLPISLYPTYFNSSNKSILDSSLIDNIRNNFSEQFLDIVFPEITDIDGSIVIGFNFLMHYTDFGGLTYQDTGDLSSSLQSLCQDNSYVFGCFPFMPNMKLQYQSSDNGEFFDLPGGELVTPATVARGINSVIGLNRENYSQYINDVVGEDISLMLLNNQELQIPSLSVSNMVLGNKKNIIVYPDPLSIYTQSYENTTSKVIVYDPSTAMSLNRISGTNFNSINNIVINISEYLRVKTLRLKISSYYGFQCNIGSFYVQDTAYDPIVYQTSTGYIQTRIQKLPDINIFTKQADSTMLGLSDNKVAVAAELSWVGPDVASDNDRLAYVVEPVASNGIDYSEIVIRGSNNESPLADTVDIDGIATPLLYIADENAVTDDPSVRILYIHNIIVDKSYFVANNLPTLSFNIKIYSLNSLRPEYIKTINFSIDNYDEAVSIYTVPDATSIAEIYDDAEKDQIKTLLNGYINPLTNAEFKAEDFDSENISRLPIWITSQIYEFPSLDPVARDITLNLPKNTNEGQTISLIPTTNLCLIGLDSNQYFDSETLTFLLENSDDSVNTLQDNTVYWFVLRAAESSDYLTTLFLHKIIVQQNND